MKYLSIIVCVVSLTACATIPMPWKVKPVEAQPSTSRDQRIDRIRKWNLKARVAIQKQDEGWSATLHWQQTEQDYVVRIIAPLGQGSYQLLKSGTGVVLSDAENRTYKAESAERLLQEQLGWRLPLGNIEYWVRGILEPNGNPQQVRTDERGLLRDFDSNGWRVSILDYVLVDALEMPRKIFMHHGDTKVRLVISSWNISGGD